jgi:hypothetical protein
MKGLVLVGSLLAVALSVSSATAMPSGTFMCRILFAPALTGTSSDEFRPSVLGTISLNGYGGYTREGKSGSVVEQGNQLTFTTGEMQGIVAVAKSDPAGRSYLHIDGNITTPPWGNPKAADVVCYKQ